MTAEKARGIAPDWSVPPEVDPFVRQPLLMRCHDCREPMWPIEAYSVVVNGVAHRGLCQPCAELRNPPGSRVEEDGQ